MMPDARIVPWTCHVCGIRFAETNGGLCSACGKVTCTACLSPELAAGTPEGELCSICRSANKPSSQSVADDDWRLQGQERYLSNAILFWRPWRESRPGWDHDHCEFCWAKFAAFNLPDILHEGYTTD